MSRKARLTFLLSGLLTLLLAADSAAWWFATNRMAADIAAWRQARIAEGAVVDFKPPERGGWPLRAELLLRSVTLATDTPNQPDAIAWQAGQVRLVYAPWHPTMLGVLVDGPQTIRFGAATPVGVDVAQFAAHIPLDASGQGQGIVITARGLAVPIQGEPVRIGSLVLRLRPPDTFVSATDTVLPGRNLPFGGTIASLDVHARISGPIPRLRDLAAALAAWRDRGQRLDVDDLALRWGPLDARGRASLGLDGALQPEGSGSVQLTGFAEVLDALSRSGAITRNDARVASTLLSLMSRPGSSDVAEADLPLTLKDRTLSVGAIPLLRVPALSVP